MNITITGLTKVYGRKTKALDDVTLNIGTGMFGLLGPNGAGKTTLMRILATLIDPTAGSVAVDGLDLRRNKERVRGLLGYLPQEFGLYRRLTAEELLYHVAVLKGLADPRQRRRQVDEVLERVNLAASRRRRIGEFSGGMKQRLGIAQALLGDPRLVIVDEPTAGLDPEERVRFRNLLAELSGSRAVILSTHIVGDVESSCTDLAVIRQGRVVFRGRPAALAGIAGGRVWNLELSDQDYQRFRSGLNILSYRRETRGFVVRALADVNPHGLGAAAEPTVEDGYLALMGGVGV